MENKQVTDGHERPAAPSEADGNGVGSMAHDLVGLIYDTAFDSELWPSLFEQLARHPMLDPAGHAMAGGFEAEARNLLLPHFERALKLSGEFYQLRTERNVILDFLDRFPIGIVIVQGNSNIVVCNRHARQLIRDNDMLYVEDNALQFRRNPARTTELRRMIREVGSGAAVPSSSPVSFNVGGEGGNRAISLWVTSVQDIYAASGADFAAVLIADAGGGRVIDADSMVSAYGLSPAEARLVGALLNGCHTVPEAAEELGISAHTARTQLKAVFGKMGVSGQGEMLKRIFTSPALFVDAGRRPAAIADAGGSVDIDAFHCLRLYDGRHLEFREYGDPGGMPVIFLHSMIHSREQLHPFSNHAEERGFRIIAPERPGYGRSEMPLKRSFSGYAEDVAQLADHLGIERFHIVGDMDGSAYALACACMLSERVIGAAAIACLPRPEDDRLDGLISFERTVMLLVRTTPIFVNHLGKLLIRGMQKNPDKYFERFGRELCAPDRRVFATPEHRRVFRESFENITPENIDGFVENYFSRLYPWDFDPKDIRVPVHLWHGEQDQRSPVGFARKLASLIPGSRTHFIEDGGHCIFYTHWHRILDGLITPLSILVILLCRWGSILLESGLADCDIYPI